MFHRHRAYGERLREVMTALLGRPLRDEEWAELKALIKLNE